MRLCCLWSRWNISNRVWTLVLSAVLLEWSDTRVFIMMWLQRDSTRPGVNRSTTLLLANWWKQMLPDGNKQAAEHLCDLSERCGRALHSSAAHFRWIMSCASTWRGSLMASPINRKVISLCRKPNNNDEWCCVGGKTIHFFFFPISTYTPGWNRAQAIFALLTTITAVLYNTFMFFLN